MYKNLFSSISLILFSLVHRRSSPSRSGVECSTAHRVASSFIYTLYIALAHPPPTPFALPQSPSPFLTNNCTIAVLFFVVLLARFTTTPAHSFPFFVVCPFVIPSVELHYIYLFYIYFLALDSVVVLLFWAVTVVCSTTSPRYSFKRCHEQQSDDDDDGDGDEENSNKPRSCTTSRLQSCTEWWRTGRCATDS